MGFFSKEEFKLIVGQSDKKGSARRELRHRVRSKIENAFKEIELAFSNSEVLVNAEHLPALALRVSIAGFKTLGLVTLAKELEDFLNKACNEIAMLKAVEEVR